MNLKNVFNKISTVGSVGIGSALISELFFENAAFALICGLGGAFFAYYTSSKYNSSPPVP